MTAPRERLKVLVCAYACDPYQGSEHAVGWGFVAELARRHEVHVIAEEEKSKPGVLKYICQTAPLEPLPRFHFIRKKRHKLLRKLWPPSYYWFYRHWQLEALALASKLHEDEHYDIVHQLNMVGYREPGYLWQMNVPFVWGPIGGMGPMPWRHLPSLGAAGAAYYVAYNIVNWWQERFSLRPRRAAQAAGAGLLSATPADQLGTSRHWGCYSKLLAEVGLPSIEPVTLMPRRVDEPLRIVWSGLHIPRKALHLGLRALAKLSPDLKWKLLVLGAGPRTKQWKRLSQQLGIEQNVSFLGWQPRDAALKVVRSSHVSLITTLRDLTSTVTVESLACGLPVICFDHTGVAAAVEDNCGIKVPLTRPKETISNLAIAIQKLFDEDLRIRMAHAALQRAKLYAWSHKVDELEAVYTACLRDRRDGYEKPDYQHYA